jgi:hypothetical protein
MKLKNPAELKYYLYISTSKLEMLYNQVASSASDKKSLEWGIDLKAFKLTRKIEAEEEPDQYDKLKEVISALEYSELIGTIDEPKDYVKGTLPMRWGLFRDAGRPSDEAPLVYFGGQTEKNRLRIRGIFKTRYW